MEEICNRFTIMIYMQAEHEPETTLKLVEICHNLRKTTFNFTDLKQIDMHQ